MAPSGVATGSLRPRRSEMTTSTRFTAKDLLRQRIATGFTVSPDGSTLVYARRTIEGGKYRARLWRVGVDGGRPEQLTVADAVDGSPRFAPDGSQIAFVSTRDEKPQLYVMPAGGGEPRQLPGFQEGVGGAEWSPDGRQLLVLASSGEDRFIVGKRDDPVARVIREPFWRLDGEGVLDRLRSAWVTTASGAGKPRRLTGPRDAVEQAAWSPDGARVTVVQDRGHDGTMYPFASAWSVPMGGGAPRRLTPTGRPVLTFGWSTHGMAYTAIDAPMPSWQNAGLWVIRGPEHVRLGEELDLMVEGFGFSDLLGSPTATPPVWLDADHVIATVSDRGTSVPWRFGLDGSAARMVEGEASCHHVVAAGGRLFAIGSSQGEAADVVEIVDGRLRPLTKDRRWFAPYHRPQEPLVVRATTKGPELRGWFVPARGAQSLRPLVCHIHGGPYSAFGPTAMMDDHALSHAGYHVLRLNPRGSVGYGEDFTRALHGVWGDPDSQDWFRAIDQLIRRGAVDRSRVGLHGLSYGGFMVHWLLANFPGKFKAAISENPFTDVVADLGAGDSGTDLREDLGLGPWPEDVAGWLARSSVFDIHRNDAPLLLLQAEADLRCPPVHSEIPFTILRMARKRTEMVRYPDESHVMVMKGRPDRRVDRLERILAWFKEYL